MEQESIISCKINKSSLQQTEFSACLVSWFMFRAKSINSMKINIGLEKHYFQRTFFLSYIQITSQLSHVMEIYWLSKGFAFCISLDMLPFFLMYIFYVTGLLSNRIYPFWTCFFHNFLAWKVYSVIELTKLNKFTEDSFPLMFIMKNDS